MARRSQPNARSPEASREVDARRGAAGVSAIELLFVTGLIATVGGIAVPPALEALDEHRAAGAARYVSSRLQRARMEAVLQSRDVAVRFDDDDGYVFAIYADGNGNGVLADDIRRGVDRRLGADERIADNFRGVDFGTLPDLPPVDAGSAAPGDDPIRLGASNAVTFTAHGTSSSGSVYLRGRGQRQFVIRIYGETGKTRVLRFESASRQWRPL